MIFFCLVGFFVCFFLFSSRGSPCCVCLHGTLLHDCSLYRHFHASLRRWTCKFHSSHQLGLCCMQCCISVSNIGLPCPCLLLCSSISCCSSVGSAVFCAFVPSHTYPLQFQKRCFFSAHLTQFLVHRWLCRCLHAGGNEQPGLTVSAWGRLILS